MMTDKSASAMERNKRWAWGCMWMLVVVVASMDEVVRWPDDGETIGFPPAVPPRAGVIRGTKGQIDACRGYDARVDSAIVPERHVDGDEEASERVSACTDGPTLIMSVAPARVHACIGRLHVVSAAAAAGSFDMPRPCVVHAHPLPPRTTTTTITCAWKLYARTGSKVDRSGAAAEKRDRYIGSLMPLRPDKDLLVGGRRRHQSVAEANSRVGVLNWGRRRAGSRMTKHRENERPACAISRYPWSPFPPRWMRGLASAFGPWLPQLRRGVVDASSSCVGVDAATARGRPNCVGLGTRAAADGRGWLVAISDRFVQSLHPMRPRIHPIAQTRGHRCRGPPAARHELELSPALVVVAPIAMNQSPPGGLEGSRDKCQGTCVWNWAARITGGVGIVKSGAGVLPSLAAEQLNSRRRGDAIITWQSVAALLVRARGLCCSGPPMGPCAPSGPMADVHHVAVGPAADCATVTLRFALPGPNRNRSGVIGPLQRRVLGGASRQPFARGDWTPKPGPWKACWAAESQREEGRRAPDERWKDSGPSACARAAATGDRRRRAPAVLVLTCGDSEEGQWRPPPANFLNLSALRVPTWPPRLVPCSESTADAQHHQQAPAGSLASQLARLASRRPTPPTRAPPGPQQASRAP
ncbi:hypothetical protein Purlil1_2887 [Purpureocillium lilacinum]|uniref:Uncharacterized protein n=1 Tax=Purpureocillium lilacinum TaxID=33203 RepID=A0ABR0C996_PURLI|nr:hypothetical protein Purlil1_2887 [Purpureocillium lilacinum]